MRYKVTEYRTKRGSKGLIIDAPDATVVTMRFDFRAGYCYVADFDNKSQVAHLLEHMMAMSCGKYPDHTEFETVFTKNGAYHNAFTSPFRMDYVAECADFEWERIFELMRDQICHPSLQKRYFDSEIGNVRSELTGNLSIANRVLPPALAQNIGFNNKTYPQYIESLDNITLPDLIEHHKKTHTAQNMRFIITGNFGDKLGRLKELLDNFDLPDGERFAIPAENLHRAEPIAINRDKVPGISFLVLMENMRELTEKGLLYGCSSSTSSNKDHSEWGFGGQANNDNLPAVFDLMVDELARVKRGEIDDMDIEDAKSFALGRYRMGIQTVSQMAAYLSGRYFYDEVILNYDDEPAKIKGVTKERMVEQARQFFDSDIWSLGIYGTTDQAMADQLYAKFAKLF